MENKKGSGIFLGVIGVATLIVAIIGATFAYFSANAGTTEDFTVQSTVLALGYEGDATGLKTSLIPAAERYALYAGTNKDWINKVTEGATGQCFDDSNNEICGAYKFTIGNPNLTTAQSMYGKIVVTKNEFTNLMFAVYDESNVQVVEPTNFSEADENGEIALPELNQKLLASTLNRGADGQPTPGFDATLPSTYTSINDMSLTENRLKENNVRTYTMIIWIEETGENQTADDSGKMFAAGIQFTTEGGGSGVTGIITAADAA